ncbi:Hypothetical predicted protein [Octopus vulgaris]|uniref:Uncharacterized protein n=1 Tax=Octopus vulgaris TaxID=6645 RepID=A0AA36AYY5_OCTVU|nr:Hypothetical predicted protein [Octopus vulgaris]
MELERTKLKTEEKRTRTKENEKAAMEEKGTRRKNLPELIDIVWEEEKKVSFAVIVVVVVVVVVVGGGGGVGVVFVEVMVMGVVDDVRFCDVHASSKTINSTCELTGNEN